VPAQLHRQEELMFIEAEYAWGVTQTTVTHTLGDGQAQRRCGALPKWRIRRLEEFLAANIDKRISLADMAAAVDLSRMHFAAQFRVATGFRPREFLLFKRVERAKAMMKASRVPIVEVAFAVGFNSQAHFSTVFKRFTGTSPARWKQECQYLA